MDRDTAIAIAVTTGTWVSVGMGTAMGVAAYKQNVRNAARNNSSSSTPSLPTMKDMAPQQRSDFERRQRAATQEQRNAEQEESQARLNYETERANKLKSARAKARAPAPAVSASSSSPTPLAMPPPAARRAETLKKQPKPVVRGAAPTQESARPRADPSAITSAAPATTVSGSEARGGGAGKRQNSVPARSRTDCTSTRRRADRGLGESFLDMN